MIKSIKIMRKIFLFFILLFPMSVYSDVNNYQDSDYVKNNFSIKEQEYLKKYILKIMIKMIILIILPIDRNWLSYYGRW